jgi:hypothetical protein
MLLPSLLDALRLLTTHPPTTTIISSGGGMEKSTTQKMASKINWTGDFFGVHLFSNTKSHTMAACVSNKSLPTTGNGTHTHTSFLFFFVGFVASPGRRYTIKPRVENSTHTTLF